MRIRLDAKTPGLSAFVTVNVRLAELFSIGLRYDSPDSGTVVVLRVNGDHGRHKNPNGEIIRGPHLHIPDAGALDTRPSAGYRLLFAEPLPPENRILTKAWALFCSRANVLPNENVAKALSRLHTDVAQQGLFDDFDGEDAGAS
jgi:hypothetical protein